jgi:hypothetical protein
MSHRGFKYTWTRTWPDKAEDYSCADGELSVGRVYRISSIAEGGWFWTCNGTYDDRTGSYSGQVATRDEACRLVEEAWDRLKTAAKHTDR